MARRFELIDGNSAKFWEIRTNGTEVVTSYGRIGSAGQTTTKCESSPAAAEKLAEKLVREKVGKGYVERGAAAAVAAEAAVEPASVGAPPLLRTGGRLLFEIADLDAEDRYLVTIAATEPELRLHFESTAGEGELRFTAGALDAARELADLSQGALVGKKSASPPFLLPRAVHARLAEGGEAKLTVGGEVRLLECTGQARATIVIDGSRHDFEVLKVEAHDLSLFVLADAACPLIVERTDGSGDTFCRLLGAGAGIGLRDELARPTFTAPVPLVEEAAPKPEAELIAILGKKGKATVRAAAAEKLLAIESDAATTALLLASVDPDSKVSQAARGVGRARGNSPGFPACLLAALETVLATKPDRLGLLLNFVSAKHAAACPELLTILRTVRRTAAGADQRHLTSVLLTNLEDLETARELVGSIDDDLDDPDSRVDALRALRLASGLESVVTRLEPMLTARADDQLFWTDAGAGFRLWEVPDAMALLSLAERAQGSARSGLERALQAVDWDAVVSAASDADLRRLAAFEEGISFRPFKNRLSSALGSVEGSRLDVVLERIPEGVELPDLVYRVTGDGQAERLAPHLVALAERADKLPLSRSPASRSSTKRPTERSQGCSSGDSEPRSTPRWGATPSSRPSSRASRPGRAIDLNGGLGRTDTGRPT